MRPSSVIVSLSRSSTSSPLDSSASLVNVDSPSCSPTARVSRQWRWRCHARGGHKGCSPNRRGWWRCAE
jgi:hypothetical protein